MSIVCALRVLLAVVYCYNTDMGIMTIEYVVTVSFLVLMYRVLHNSEIKGVGIRLKQHA